MFQSHESSAEESSDYATSRRKKSKKGKSRMTTEDFEIPRISSRNGRELPNYNEENMHIDLSDEDDETFYAVDYTAIQSSGDAIDGVYDHKRHDDHLDDAEDKPTVNLRYLVKWQGYSYIHNTWETYDHLKQFRGFKRVENYIKGPWTQQYMLRHDPATSREDIEALEIERERQREQLEAYKQVERIIAQRDAPASIDVDHDHLEYFCKWRGLTYSESTWEDHDTVQPIAAEAIEDFLARTASETVPHRSLNYSSGRPAFQRLSAQPSYIENGTLKDFQMTGLNWLAYLWSREENGILADEVRPCGG